SLDLPMSVNCGTLVCELIEKENKEKQEEVVRKFSIFGLNNYKKYYLWEYKNAEIVDMENKGLTFVEECEYDVSADLYKIFDHYSERLPLLRDSENFCARMGQLICWDGDEYVGAVIYSVNGNVATEEFIYVVESARGKGYAKVLENKFVSHCIHALHLKRIYAWVEINNTKSVVLHQSAGYLKTDQYKLTLKREHFGCEEV
nr:GNAT family N-acetyltransferase [Lachnospiraceae bacterium]